MGHTHEDIDQMFSCLSRHLNRNELATLDGFQAAWASCYSKTHVQCSTVDTVHDFKHFVNAYVADLHGYTASGAVQLFHIHRRSSDGRVCVSVKHRSTDGNWRDTQPLFKKTLPDHWPIREVPRRPLDLDTLRKEVPVFLQFMKARDPTNQAALADHWRRFIDRLENAQQTACSECNRLTGILQQTSVRGSDTPSAQAQNRKIVRDTERELRAHLTEKTADHAPSTQWRMPEPCNADVSEALVTTEHKGPLLWSGRKPRSAATEDVTDIRGCVVVKGSETEPFWVGKVLKVIAPTAEQCSDEGVKIQWYSSTTSAGVWRPNGPYALQYTTNPNGKQVRHTDTLGWDTAIVVTDFKLTASGLLPADTIRLISDNPAIDYRCP